MRMFQGEALQSQKAVQGAIKTLQDFGVVPSMAVPQAPKETAIKGGTCLPGAAGLCLS